MNLELRKQTRTLDLPDTKDGFTLASNIEVGNLLTLAGAEPTTVTAIEPGVDFNMKRVVLISTEDNPVPKPYSPRAYLSVI